MYEGHDGIRDMLEHASNTHGPYWVELDELSECAGEVIRASARAIRPGPDGSAIKRPIRLAIAMRAGLVVRVETYPAESAL